MQWLTTLLRRVLGPRDVEEATRPMEYSEEEWRLIQERDSLQPTPPPFRKWWVIYVDVAGLSRRIADPTQRVRLAHTYFDLASSLLWGSRHHRVLDIASCVAGRDDPIVQQQRALERLQKWRRHLRVFSDSIFLFFMPRSPAHDISSTDYALDGRFVPSAAASLSRALWTAGLPHKGAVAFGDCFIDLETNVFVGPAIVEAVAWEKRQEWFGISVDPGSQTDARRDFQSEPFCAPHGVPVRNRDGSFGKESTLIIDPSEAAMFELKFGDGIRQDRALDGLLAARPGYFLEPRRPAPRASSS